LPELLQHDQNAIIHRDDWAEIAEPLDAVRTQKRDGFDRFPAKTDLFGKTLIDRV
jgi:hypothetical protein